MPIDWQLATVSAIRDETPTVRSLTLELPAWTGHRAGQHVDLRLTAQDGYSVERSSKFGHSHGHVARFRMHNNFCQ